MKRHGKQETNLIACMRFENDDKSVVEMLFAFPLCHRLSPIVPDYYISMQRNKQTEVENIWQKLKHIYLASSVFRTSEMHIWPV